MPPLGPQCGSSHSTGLRTNVVWAANNHVCPQFGDWAPGPSASSKVIVRQDVSPSGPADKRKPHTGANSAGPSRPYVAWGSGERCVPWAILQTLGSSRFSSTISWGLVCQSRAFATSSRGSHSLDHLPRVCSPVGVSWPDPVVPLRQSLSSLTKPCRPRLRLTLVTDWRGGGRSYQGEASAL